MNRSKEQYIEDINGLLQQCQKETTLHFIKTLLTKMLQNDEP